MASRKYDPKYLGIQNINFSLTSKDDKREKQFKQQRLIRGFDDSETWSLKDTIANFIIPRLERYEEIAKDFLIRDEKLIKDIESFLTAMRLVTKDGNGETLTKEEWDKLSNGLETFPNIFMSLWW